MQQQLRRASHSEIFEHLEALLGQHAVQTVVKVADLSGSRSCEAALTTLKTYDATLGGFGLFSFSDKRPQGVYRAFFYVELPLRHPGAANQSRFMILSACVYLEELLKQVVRLWPWETFKADALPLGQLLNKASPHLPSDLAGELRWLSNGVYNFAKHDFNLNDDFGDHQPEHYFGLDEAIAIYLITRNLGLQLEQLIGKTPEQLMRE